ncbi:MAG: tyrosine-type recombinase/integrase [Allorhizobium sp.]
MKKPAQPKIRYIAWRRGRPRFEPSPTLRQRGYSGHDLKTPDGEWMREHEARLWSADFARKLEAEAREQKRKRGRPKAPTGLPVARRSTSVGDLLEDWLHVQHNPSIADLRPNTVRYYRQQLTVLETHAPDIWSAAAEALDKPVCIGLYDKLRSKIGLNTAVATLRVLGIGLQWGMDRGRLPSMTVNPAHKLKMKTPAPRIRAGTPEEVAHLVATADAFGRPEIGDMVTLAIWSGQRQADRLALSYSGRGTGRLIFRQEKTRAIVSVPEAPELASRLDAALERRRRAEVISPYVILDERRWLPFQPDYYRHMFDDIRAAAAKTMPSLKTLRDQDLRDTAVTWLARAECTIPEICSITGHSFVTANTIMKHYLAMHPEMADNAMAKMVAWFEGRSA